MKIFRDPCMWFATGFKSWSVASDWQKKKYLRLTIEKIYKITVFTNKYLRSCSSTRTYFTAANPKTEMQSKITEIQII